MPGQGNVFSACLFSPEATPDEKLLSYRGLGNGTVIGKALNEFKKLIHLIDCARNLESSTLTLSTIQINSYSTFDEKVSQGAFQ